MAGIELFLTALCLNITCENGTDFSSLVVNNISHNLSDDIESAPNEVKESYLAGLRDQLNGKKLTIATMDDPPLSYVEMVNGTTIGKGVAFEILKFLTEKFNFTYDIIIPQKNSFGSSTDFDGSIIELLNSSKADLAAAFIPILSDARNFVYYSTTTLDEGEYIMIMKRPAESATGSGLLAPFDAIVWMLILISLLSVGPIIYGLIILRYKLTREGKQKVYPLPYCIWFVYGALMKQGSTLAPVADSTRLLFATWWIFITILTSFYTANLTAFLTLSKFTLPINNVDDILKKNQLFIAQKGGCIQYVISNSNESLNHLNKMVISGRGIFADDGTDEFILNSFVKERGYVYIKDRPALDHIIYKDYNERKLISMTDEKIQCPFAVAKTPFLKRKRAFAYPRNSQLQLNHLFDPELLHLVESGIVKYMLWEDLPNAEICPQNLGGTERQLRNGDLLMTYYIMITGFCTSIVVFTTELLFKYLGNKCGWYDTNNKMSSSYIKPKTKIPSPPPPYLDSIIGNNIHSWSWTSNNQLLKSNQKEAYQQYINGRQYMVFRESDGTRRLVPLRVPSATLFQYTN